LRQLRSPRKKTKKVNIQIFYFKPQQNLRRSNFRRTQIDIKEAINLTHAVIKILCPICNEWHEEGYRHSEKCAKAMDQILQEQQKQITKTLSQINL
jgi:hypothetical protein